MTKIAEAEYPRDSAINLVLNHILANDIGSINVYASINARSGYKGLSLYYDTAVPYPFESNWVFFVDDLPSVGWEHPCRYIFVNEENGADSIVTNKKTYPSGLYQDFDPISMVAIGDTCGPIYNPQPTPTISNSLPPNPHLYAVIISGIDDISTSGPDPRFWNDVSSIYSTLEKVYGYKKENMFVHYFTGTGARGNILDGGNIPDIDYPAYKWRIHHTFYCLAGDSIDSLIPKLNPDDQLFVFVTDHGDQTSTNHSYIKLPIENQTNTFDPLYDTMLANYVKNINCGQMIFLLQQCNSGGFIPWLKDSSIYNVKCKNRSIYTSSRCDQHASNEDHITGSRYGEFAFYWTAAVRGYFPDLKNDHPWALGFPVYDHENYPDFPYKNCFDTCTHPYVNPDSNGDGVVTMEEAFTFANNYDAWSDSGFYCQIEHPLPDQPQRYNNICFKEDLQSLFGLIGKITTTNQTVENRNYVIGGPIKVINGATLTFYSNSHVYFINPGSLDVDMESTLNPGTSMSFEGSNENSVLIEGTLGALQGVTFSTDSYDHSEQSFGGLYLDNTNLATTMDSVHFSNAGFLQHHGQSLKIDSSDFTNCDYFISYADSVDISHSQFNNTFVYLSDITQNSSAIAVIDHNTFNSSENPYNCDLIELNHFDYFNIHYNDISQANHSGIGLYYCGHGIPGNRNIQNNHITYCGEYGINVFNSNAVVKNNQIHHNNRGVNSLNSTYLQILGNPNAHNSTETQMIVDNSAYEIYTAKESFPVIKNTMIYDNVNSGYLIFNDDGSCDHCYDVTYNCWEDNYGSLQDQLYPNGSYTWNPTWCPHDPDQPQYGQDEDMLNNADSLFGTGNYTEAENIYFSIVDLFPHTKSSQSALKELFDVEQYSANNYNTLKQYYLINDSIHADTNLEKLGEFLANRCDVQMHNWSQAINWYENRIMNPPSDVDSICAIIDLEALYLLMENDSTKSSYIVKLPQYKPTTVVRYRIYRDSLIALLPFNHKTTPLTTPITSLKINELLQNNPNPFSTSSDIWYKIDPNCYQAFIKITDFTGRICNLIQLSEFSKGSHKVTIDAYTLNPGIYLYSLEVDGKITDTKKMVVIR
jgi:hypothetical protein